MAFDPLQPQVSFGDGVPKIEKIARHESSDDRRVSRRAAPGAGGRHGRALGGFERQHRSEVRDRRGGQVAR